MAYAMQLSSLEDFAMESEEKAAIYADLIEGYLAKDPRLQSMPVLSLLCQGLTLSCQMMALADEAMEEPVFVEDNPEKIMIVEEDMYLLETIALSQVYCESQLRNLSISAKLN